MRTIRFIRQKTIALIMVAIAFAGCDKEKEPVSVSGVSLNESELTLIVGVNDTLVATVVPDEATDKAVEWSSSNEKVVTVSNAGVVTAIAAGEATVVATTHDGSFTAECAVTVNEAEIAVTGVSLSHDAIVLEIDYTFHLTATVQPSNATDTTVTWNSSNEAVATVSSTGLVTAISKGAATITAITQDGGKTTKCAVTVTVPDVPYITMVADTAEVSIMFFDFPSGEVSINWGDGTERETYNISVYTACKHTYSDTIAHTIRVYCENTTYLNCNNNQLTSLDVSQNTALKTLYCYDNQLTSLDVSQNTALKDLFCYNNQLTSLDVSQNTALEILLCSNNQLTTLDVSNNTALTILNCTANPLTYLDVSKNTALTRLDCFATQLTTLDVSKNIALTNLNCFTGQLTSLDVSKNTALTYLFCGGQLTSLDVSNNIALTYLWCNNNLLTDLDVTNNTALTNLDCRDNKFTADGLNALFGTLHSNTIADGKTIYIEHNPGTATCDRSIATNKGWTVND